jgi:14-3-3 protein epsilon
MQLLLDNLTLWTSSDSGEPEGAPADAAPKETEKAAESADKPEEPKAEAAPES